MNILSKYSLLYITDLFLINSVKASIDFNLDNTSLGRLPNNYTNYYQRYSGPYFEPCLDMHISVPMFAHNSLLILPPVNAAGVKVNSPKYS